MPPSNDTRHLALLTAVIVALFGGCMSPRAAVCGDGRICPPNTRCDVERHLCVVDAQELACVDHTEGSECVVAEVKGTCRAGLCKLLFCGDGMRSGTESCDGDDLNDKTCASLGFYKQTAGGLACKDDCTFDTTHCTGACGDQMINGTEDHGTELCDGSNLGGADCRTAGFYDAPGLRCSPYCTFDVAACTGFCGDAKMNGPEQCDGAPPLGKTCVDYGFDRGRVGCSALCGPDLGGCGQIGWKTVLAGSFNGLWGAAGNDLFAVGPKGKIVRGDGTTWSTMKSGTTEDLFRVWGSGPKDVFAVGGSSILHWNGTEWSPMTLPVGVVPGLGPIWGDVWGSGPNDVYVVGFAGPLLHWNGSTWFATQLAAGSWWSGIWGSGSDDVYVVGSMIRHWDGKRWLDMTGPGPDKVWGSGPKDVFACGSLSCWHWNGRWSETTWAPDIVGQVSSIWGSGPNDVLAIVGAHLMHWDGTSWSETASPDVRHAIWGTGPEDVFIAGGSGIQHRTGDNWFAKTLPMIIGSLWAGGPNDLFVGGAANDSTCPDTVGGECSAPLLVPHSGMTFLPRGTVVVDVWGTSSSDVFGVTGDGDIYHSDGTSWSASYEGAFAWRLRGSGQDSVFALGGPPAAGTPKRPTLDPSHLSHVVRWDGHRWSPTPLPDATRLLSGLWATSQDQAFAVGEAGQIVRWDGKVWLAMESGSTENLIDVWGSGRDDVYAVGTGGTVLHYDGAKWSPMRSGSIPAESSLFRVRGSGRGDVFVLGGYANDPSPFQATGHLLFHLRTGDWERVALLGVIAQELAVTPSRVFLGQGSELRQLNREGVTCDGPEKNCGDGWDNDCDGLADEDDPDCKGKIPEQCANLFDDDGNGLIDCADPGCATFPSCRRR